MRRTLVLLSTSLALLVLWFAISAHAQSSSSATINGRVTDPSGAVVPGVTVAVRNLDTGIEQSTKTTSDGLYRLVNLTPGNYRVQTAQVSFKSTKCVATANTTVTAGGLRLTVILRFAPTCT